MLKKEIVEAYGTIYGYLYSNDLRHKKINYIFPLFELSIQENTEAVKEFQNKILEDILMSDREYAAAFCTMYLYDKYSRNIAEATGNKEVVESVIHNAFKWK